MSVLGVKKRPQGIFDSDLEFKDSAAVTSSAAAQVDSAPKVIDVGTGLFKGCMILDVSAIKTSGDDEIYDIVVQGSTVAAFATDTEIVELAAISLGAKQAKRTDSDKDDATGRYKVFFDNENNGTFYRYLRVYTVTAGTSETITYTAYCSPIQ